MQRCKLSEGIHLNLLPSEKFKTNFLSVCFVVPLEKENAHLTALVPKVLSRGCKAYPDMAAISERLEYLYASDISAVYVKRAESLIVGFSADFVKDAFLPEKGENLLNSVSALLFDILFDPLIENGAFRESYVAGEKADLINAIGAKINNKAAYAKERCTEIMFGARPYGISELGTVEEVRAATSKQIYERYKQLVETAPIEIFFNGECNAEELSALVKSRIPVGAHRKTSFPTRAFLDGEPDEVTEVTDEMPVAQGKLVMGLRMSGVNVNAPDAAAFNVFNEIFGGSANSKLFMNVREAMSLCYYCRSMPDMFMSALFISSGIEPENREKAKKAILEQLDAMKAGDFSDDDIAEAKLSLCNAYKELDDSASALCLWYLSRVIFGNDGTPEDTMEKIRAVTADEIRAAAEKVSLDTVYFIKGTGKSNSEEA